MEITAGLAKLKSQINKLERRIHQLDMNEVDPKELHAAIESLNALKSRYKEMKEEHEKKKQEKESKVLSTDATHGEGDCPRCGTNPIPGKEMCETCKTHVKQLDVEIPPIQAADAPAEIPSDVPSEIPSEEPKKDTADGGAVIMKFPRRPHRKPKHHYNVVDVPTPSAIPGEAPQEKQSDVVKFAIHDVVEPSRGTPGSKGRVMGHDESNDMVYVAWSEGSLKDSHGYGAYSAKDLKKSASIKQAGPGAGREFEVEKNDILEGSFIYNLETGKMSWKQMPTVEAFNLLGYYDGIRDADGKLLKITDVNAGWWEHGEANIKADLATLMKEWQQETPIVFRDSSGDIEVRVDFTGLKAMLGGGYMRTVYKPGDTFQACGDGYLSYNYESYEVGLCASLQWQEGVTEFEQDVFENTSPEEREDGEPLSDWDYQDHYEMQTEPYKIRRKKQTSSKKDVLKKEAASASLSQKLIGDLKRAGWDLVDASDFSVDLKRAGMSLEIYEDGASGYQDSPTMFDFYMSKNKALTDKIQQDFEEGYQNSGHRNWAPWREEWVQDNMKVKPEHSGNTYNDDPAYFWGTTFEYTSYDGGAIVQFHHGGDVRGNYGLPEVWDGDFDEVYSMLSHDDSEAEVSSYIGEDLLERIRAEVWGKDMAEIPSVSSKKQHMVKQAAANEAVIDSFVNRIDPNVKSNNLYIRDRGDSWELVNYQTVIAKHLGDKIMADHKKYSVTTTKLQSLISYKASQAGVPVYDMDTNQPMDHSREREPGKFEKLPSNTPYERISEKQADDHDPITDEPMEEVEVSDEQDPSDEDIFIQDDRGKTHAWYTGKPIASLKNDDWDAFYMEIAQWMDSNGYSPNVWTISDHGNAHLVTDIPQVAKSAAGYESQSPVEEMAESFINGNISWVRKQLQRRPKLKQQVSEWMKEFAPKESESFDRLMGVAPKEDVYMEGSTDKSADHLYGMQSVSANPLQNGDLEISVSDPAELQEIKDAVASGDQSDASMYDVFERIIANGYSWVAPEQIGALTDAPILSDSPSLDDGSLDPQASVWWYPQYETRSPLEDIAETGKTVFTLAKPDTTAAFKGQKLVKKANTMETKCESCGKELGPEAFLSKWPVCGACTRKRHKEVTNPGSRNKEKKSANQIPLNVFDGGFYAVETSGNPSVPHGYAVFDPKGQQVMVVTTEEQLSPDRLSSIVHDEYGKRELVRATLKADHEAFKTGTKFVVSGINRTKKQIRVKSEKTHVWLPIDKVAVSVDLEQHIQQMKDRLNTTQTTLEQAVTTQATVEKEADEPMPNTPAPQGMRWAFDADVRKWILVKKQGL